jgi:hypothetical protein
MVALNARTKRPLQLLASGLVCTMLALMLGGRVASASAASAPNAYTGGSSALTTTSATLAGSIYPSNQLTSCYFQYGTTVAYGAQTPLTPAGAGTQTIHVSASVSGLTPYTTYHYRLVAVNPAGTTFGQDRELVTKKIPLSFKVVLPTPNREAYRTPFTVSGVLSGTGSAGHQVLLEASPFPYVAAFQSISETELTDASGFFSFRVAGLTQSSQVRVAALEPPPNQPYYSHPAVMQVTARVTLHVRPSSRAGYVILHGTVEPPQSLALVNFELLRPHHKIEYVGKVIIGGGAHQVSRFSHQVRIRHAGLYRAVVRIPGGAQVPGHSSALFIR